MLVDTPCMYVLGACIYVYMHGMYSPCFAMWAVFVASCGRAGRILGFHELLGLRA